MNVFGDTKYTHPEEDRMTNAFLSVVEKADRAFLSMVLEKISCKAAAEILTVEPQIQYAEQGSRPDGRIELRDVVVLVESKRFSSFDTDQLRRHVDGMIANETKPKILLCIAEPEKSPISAETVSGAEIPICYLSWRQIHKIAIEHISSSSSEVSRFLCMELSDLLNMEGYGIYKESTMESLQSLANEYLSISARLAEQRQNMLNLARSTTLHIDSLLEKEHDWRYHVLDDSWMKEYSTLFEFMLLREDIGLRLNFEIYIDFKGSWIGISKWSKIPGKAREKILIIGNKLKARDQKWRFSSEDPSISRVISNSEIKALFSEKFESNDELFSDFLLLYKQFTSI